MHFIPFVKFNEHEAAQSPYVVPPITIWVDIVWLSKLFDKLIFAHSSHFVLNILCRCCRYSISTNDQIEDECNQNYGCGRDQCSDRIPNWERCGRHSWVQFWFVRRKVSRDPRVLSLRSNSSSIATNR